ncbi:MAG: hydroxymethylbilane synthase [Pseudomonadota bacterium]
MTETLRIATRQSKLALWQANFVRDQLRAAHPGLVVELVGMTTEGDRWLSAPLSEIGGKGLFIKELEAALLAGDADIAVHSMKDLPAEIPVGFDLPVIAYRAPVEDVLISSAGGLAELPVGATVGSSSLRRKAQLLKQRGDLNVLPIRGNVDTRLSKMIAGEYDAIVLAVAGLQRLELEPAGMHVLDTDLCLPAPGQGALGIECLADSPVVGLLKPLADSAVARCVLAERAISAGFGADCSLPIAALAEPGADGALRLRARVGAEDGSRILHAQAVGPEPEAVAAVVLASLREQGADALLNNRPG